MGPGKPQDAWGFSMAGDQNSGWHGSEPQDAWGFELWTYGPEPQDGLGVPFCIESSDAKEIKCMGV
jgi:hypothetical protein